MTNNTFLIFFNLTAILFYYISKKYHISFETASGIAKGLYYIYFLCEKEKDKNKIRENTILCCKSLIDTCHMKVNVFGYKMSNVPIIYVCNHSSWIDSVILKYLLPDVYTIAKSDVNKEFVIENINSIINSILTTWGVIYYERGSKKAGKEVRRKIVEHIKENNGSILLYPEGTAYAMGGPRTFYPGSFETAFQNDILIQPITLKYLSDITWGITNEYSKKYHAELFRNIKKCQKQINNVDVTFHPIVNPKNFKDHLHMKRYCEVLITDEWINQHHYKTSSINRI